MRSICVVFYEVLPRPIALKIAQTWIDKLNNSDAAKSVDLFDKPKFDPFKQLPEAFQRRSEIQFIKWVHSMYGVFNAFAAPIDFLLDKVLVFELVDDVRFGKAVNLVKEQVNAL